MAIATLAQYRAARKQRLNALLSTSTGAAAPLWRQAKGSPPAISNTANGVVPDNTTTGWALVVLPALEAGKTMYLTGAEVSSGSASVSNQLILGDRLFHAGPYSFNANVTLASQPSFSARVPGTDYKGTEIWIENASTVAGTGIQSVTVTYTNQDGVAGRTTGAVANPSAAVFGANTYQAWKMPLQQGDTGVQKIDSVVGTVATAGQFNVVVFRPLLRIANPVNGMGLEHLPMMAVDAVRSGLPQIFPTSCISGWLQNVAGGAAAQTGEIMLEATQG